MLSLLLQQSLGSGREFHDKTSVWQSTLAALWYWVARQRLVPEIIVVTITFRQLLWPRERLLRLHPPPELKHQELLRLEGFLTRLLRPQPVDLFSGTISTETQPVTITLLHRQSLIFHMKGPLLLRTCNSLYHHCLLRMLVFIIARSLMPLVPSHQTQTQLIRAGLL